MTDEEIAREAAMRTCEHCHNPCPCRLDGDNPATLVGMDCEDRYAAALAAIALLRERERQGGDRLSHDGERG